jgi:hypothetical protein
MTIKKEKEHEKVIKNSDPHLTYTIEFDSIPEAYFKGNSSHFLKHVLIASDYDINDLSILIQPHKVQFVTSQRKLSDEELATIKSKILDFFYSIRPTTYQLKLNLNKKVTLDEIDEALLWISMQLGFHVGPMNLSWQKGELTFETLKPLSESQWESLKTNLKTELEMQPDESISEIFLPENADKKLLTKQKEITIPKDIIEFPDYLEKYQKEVIKRIFTINAEKRFHTCLDEEGQPQNHNTFHLEYFVEGSIGQTGITRYQKNYKKSFISYVAKALQANLPADRKLEVSDLVGKILEIRQTPNETTIKQVFEDDKNSYQIWKERNRRPVW